jgi:SAM-dependent methyltransferase
MIPYTSEPAHTLQTLNAPIAAFELGNANIDLTTVSSFGEEWSKFDHFSSEEIQQNGDEYFDIVAPHMLTAEHTVLDAGCGTGRWSLYAAGRAKFVEAIDPSSAVLTAARLTASQPNIRVTQASIDHLPFADKSFDFVMSLGVLHHIPDTALAMRNVTDKLKVGGWALYYLYYNLDNRSSTFRSLFNASNSLRNIISRFPSGPKKFVCDILAVTAYLPFIGFASVVRAIQPNSSAYKRFPLSYYVGKSWNVVRNDALDRFGTPLEQRFSREQISEMMTKAGLVDIQFSSQTPFWHAVGRKAE